MRTHKSFVKPPGTVSDDTKMTLLLAQSLVQNEGAIDTKIVESYQNWLNSSTPASGVGKTITSLFKGVKTYKGYQNRMNKIIESWVISESNGSLMRVAPAVMPY
jgi:ADP-ribosylglycohydrolase